MIGDVFTIRGSIPCVARVENVRAATPGWLFIPAPIRLTFPRSSLDVQRTPRRSSAAAVSAWSGVGAENTIPSSRVWRIVSTFTDACAIASNSGAAATPSTRYTVSSSVCVTPEIIAFSSMRSSSSRIQVPSASANDERTCSVTPWLRANSTERSAITRAPEAAISSISSYVTWRSLRASGTTRGSAVNTPSTSV